MLLFTYMYFFYNNKINKVMEVYSLPCLKKKKFSWTKELRTLDKKLNGKKTSEIKKKKVLLGKRCLQTLKS